MKKSMNIERLIRKGIFVGLGGVLIGFFLLVAVYLLPTEPMKVNIEKSADDLFSAGNWPILIDGYAGSTLDRFTDSIMLSVAVYDNEQSVFVKAMQNYYAMETPDTLPTDSLQAYLQGKDCYGENYARYWHGYLAVLKPLLMLFSYGELCVLNSIALSLLIIYVIILLSKNLSKGAAGIFVLSFLFLMPITLFRCIDMSNMFYVTLLSMIVLLKKKEIWKKECNIYIYFMAVGMITSYMDFLTYPVITLGIPLITYIVMQVIEKQKPFGMAESVISITLWGLGYGGMWGMKWILASLISGENVIRNALQTVKTRSGMRVEKNALLVRFDAIIDNFKVLSEGIYGYILVFLILAVLGFSVWTWRKNREVVKGGALLPLLLVALFPVGWLFVTSEHASIHSWFTYRNLVVSVYAVGMTGVSIYAMWKNNFPTSA